MHRQTFKCRQATLAVIFGSGSTDTQVFGENSSFSLNLYLFCFHSLLVNHSHPKSLPNVNLNNFTWSERLCESTEL